MKVQRPAALSIISKVCAWWLQQCAVDSCSNLPDLIAEISSSLVITVLQDLYVMRRAVVLYERLIRRFTAQTTDYQILLSTFAGAQLPPCWNSLLTP